MRSKRLCEDDSGTKYAPCTMRQWRQSAARMGAACATELPLCVCEKMPVWLCYPIYSALLVSRRLVAMRRTSAQIVATSARHAQALCG